MWSPTGKARGTLLHAPVGQHLPTNAGTHTSAAKGRGLLLPGPKFLPTAGRQMSNQYQNPNTKNFLFELEHSFDFWISKFGLNPNLEFLQNIFVVNLFQFLFMG